MEFPKLVNGECDSLGCGSNSEFCYCNLWLNSREEFQKLYNKPWSEEFPRPEDQKIWEASFRVMMKSINIAEELHHSREKATRRATWEYTDKLNKKIKDLKNQLKVYELKEIQNGK